MLALEEYDVMAQFYGTHGYITPRGDYARQVLGELEDETWPSMSPGAFVGAPFFLAAFLLFPFISWSLCWLETRDYTWGKKIGS